MANNNQQNQANKTASGTSVQHVKQQNAQQNQQQFGAEFASETNAQQVRQQNAQSAAKKNQQNQQQ
ncbi:spore protein [Bacillus sp. LL01]|uniref:gamma-type small acid-soluble spore protein n=1 Tax=Bacillus sp. LL01 TaxID=1665556 RepID=UPI00064D414A|nr:gamma-type small acid-soluble spore protein [Bacillus sp. LL01]KMJ57372.1 spore protein [Bacillus sp. LL01]